MAAPLPLFFYCLHIESSKLVQLPSEGLNINTFILQDDALMLQEQARADNQTDIILT
jgi:hypothetical protein